MKIPINKYKGMLFDLDGTGYLAEKLLPGVKEWLHELKCRGIPYWFMTNNTSKTPDDFAKLLREMGVECKSEQVLTPLCSLVRELAKGNFKQAALFMNKSCCKWVQTKLPNLQLNNNNPDVFVLGFHTEFIYQELADFCLALQRNTQAPLIATHPDKICPWQGGFIPDVGVWIDVIAETTGRSPNLVLGKPDPSMALSALEQFAPSELLMFGDRLYTDYELCRRSQIDFCLMLTGESNKESIKAYAPDAFYLLAEFTHIQSIIGTNQ